MISEKAMEQFKKKNIDTICTNKKQHILLSVRGETKAFFFKDNILKLMLGNV